MSDTITKQEPKLSVRKPGYWRNAYRSPTGDWRDKRTGEVIKGDLVSPFKWPSREVAEQKGLTAKLRQPSPDWDDVEYLGPVFFLEEGAQ